MQFDGLNSPVTATLAPPYPPVALLYQFKERTLGEKAGAANRCQYWVSAGLRLLLGIYLDKSPELNHSPTRQLCFGMQLTLTVTTDG